MNPTGVEVCLSHKEADGSVSQMGCGDPLFVCPLVLAILFVGGLLALRWDKR